MEKRTKICYFILEKRTKCVSLHCEKRTNICLNEEQMDRLLFHKKAKKIHNTTNKEDVITPCI